MEPPNFKYARQIMRSPLFLSQPIEEQRNVLFQILQTGEIPQKDLNRIVAEERQRQKERQETVDLANFLNSLDYNTFLTFVVSGQIRGEKLLALCGGSEKLNGYCNRGFQLRNASGNPVGQPQDQYLFRVLLEKMGVRNAINPRRTYIDKTIGGVVLGFGNNDYGQLGIGNQLDRDHPVLIPNFKNIVQVSTNLSTSYLIDSRGRVFSFGWGGGGQLGLDEMYKTTPTLIPDLNDVIEISAGGGFALCLDKYGRVWSFGDGNLGSLGVGDHYKSKELNLIPNFGNIVKVSAGDVGSFCLDNQGKVWAFGGNDLGQLGLGDIEDRSIPTLIPTLKDIVQIDAGTVFTLCLDKQGRVWSFGGNDDGQLGLGDNDNRNVPTLNPYLEDIVQVSAGTSFTSQSLCLDKNGRVWSFGSGEYGALGLDDEENRNIPYLIPSLPFIVEISCGGQHSLCLDNQGRVWGFGFTVNGELGLGDDDTDQYIPVLIPGLDNIIQVNSKGDHSLCIRRR